MIEVAGEMVGCFVLEKVNSSNIKKNSGWLHVDGAFIFLVIP